MIIDPEKMTIGVELKFNMPNEKSFCLGAKFFTKDGKLPSGLVDKVFRNMVARSKEELKRRGVLE